jgi:peroxiredoxin family protein
MVGNPSAPVPTMLAGLPGMESLAGSMMMKQMKELELPTVREFLQILDEAGAELYACELAMKMFKRDKKDLAPQVRDVITAGDFYDLAEGAQIIFT